MSDFKHVCSSVQSYDSMINITYTQSCYIIQVEEKTPKPVRRTMCFPSMTSGLVQILTTQIDV